ncbi:MAG: NUDIX domain-containing protein [Microthrixaceae bacterium]
MDLATKGSNLARTELSKFPRPSLAVDVAVLTVVGGQLAVVLWRRTGATNTDTWALPGSFVRERERLADAVGRTLRDKCGIEGLDPSQLAVMDDPARDDRGWVVSVAHLDVVRQSGIEQRGPDTRVRLAPVRHKPMGRRSILELPDGQAKLPFDHERIATLAIDELRERYSKLPDPSGLLDDGFTILQLRRLHEAVAGSTLQKDTFRRTMVPHLEPLEAVEEGVVGRPAQLFRRAGVD